ncbi:MAG: discoidin domain-containing protein [Fibrobacterales bacterium]
MFGILLLSSIAYSQRANLAYNRTPVETNDLNFQLSPDRVVDGNTTSDNSRWGSAFENGPFYIIIDLGEVYLIDEIILFWEAAAASQYSIEVSTDDVNIASEQRTWELIENINDGAPGETKAVIFSEREARFVKVTCKRRTGIYGYSLYEVEVFGESNPNYPSKMKLSTNTDVGMVGQDVTLSAKIYNSAGVELVDKSNGVTWNILDHDRATDDVLSSDVGESVLFTAEVPYRTVWIEAEYADSEWPRFSFTDTLKIYIDPDASIYDGPVRCDLVTKKDACIDLDQLNNSTVIVPENITRISENGVNICLPPDLSFTAPLNIVFVVDQSGSMFTHHDGTFRAPKAVRRSLDTLLKKAPQSSVGFMGFAAGICNGTQEIYDASWPGWGPSTRRSDSVDTRVKPGLLSDTDQWNKLVYQSSYDETDFWYGCGSKRVYGTWYSSPIIEAAKWLEEVSQTNDNESIIIFLTDGSPTDDPGIQDAFNNFAVGLDSTNFPPIYPISLTSTVHYTLSDIATQTKGQVFQINSADQIDQAMQAILTNTLLERDPDRTIITNAKNDQELESTEYIKFDQNDKLYQVVSTLLPLDIGTNKLNIVALSDRDTSNAFESNITIDVSKGPLSTLGRHDISSSLFDAVCYETPTLSVVSSTGSPLTSLGSNVANLGLELHTRSCGFTPEVSMVSDNDSESIELEFTNHIFSNYAVASTADENPTPKNDIIEGLSGETFEFTWVHPLDPRETAFTQIDIEDGPIQPSPRASYIYDRDLDGAADQIIIFFDSDLRELPEEITSIDWPTDEKNSITVKKDNLSFLERDDKKNYAVIVVELDKPFPVGLTTMDTQDEPTLRVDGVKVAIQDSIGPVLVRALSIPARNYQYAVKDADGDYTYHFQPDTLMVFASENIIRKDHWPDMFTITTSKGKTFTLPLTKKPSKGEEGISWMVLLDKEQGSPAITVGDEISFTPNSGVTDVYDNEVTEHSVTIEGEAFARSVIGAQFRSSVIGVENVNKGSIATEVIPVFDEDGEPLDESVRASATLDDSWVAPYNYFDGVFEEQSDEEQCEDGRSLNNNFDHHCLASLVVGTFEGQGSYTATVYVLDHLGQFITSWSQRFGFCDEFQNEYRIEQTNIHGFFINDLIWDIKDTDNRLVGSGVYYWQVTLAFDSGATESFTEQMGVVRQNIQCE